MVTTAKGFAPTCDFGSGKVVVVVIVLTVLLVSTLRLLGVVQNQIVLNVLPASILVENVILILLM